MDWSNRFKMLKAYFGLTNKDISEITGLTENMVQRASSEKHFSKHLKFTVWVFEKMYKSK